MKHWVAQAFPVGGNQVEGDPFYLLFYAKTADECRGMITKYQMTHQQRLSIPITPLLFEEWREGYFLPKGVEAYLKRLDEHNRLDVFVPDPDGHAGINCLVEQTVSFQPLCYSPVNDTQLPKDFEDILFPGGNLFCYALIEPKTADMVWQTEKSGLPAKRLYQDIYDPWLNGELIDDEPWYHALVQRSPWLVRLEPDHELTQKLFAHDPDNPDAIFTFWQHHAAMFFVSPMDFDAFFAHCQKFALLENYQKKRMLFNYFRSDTLILYLHANALYPKKLAAFFGTPDNEKITRIIADMQDKMVVFSTCDIPPDIEPAPVVLDEADMQILIDKYNREVLFPPLADQLLTDLPELKDRYGQKELVEKFMNNTRQLKQYNIKNSHNVYQTVLYDLLFGEDWLDKDPENKFWKILESDNTDDEKYCRLKHHMAHLEQEEIIKKIIG